MKIEVLDNNKVFKPVTIGLTFETERELDFVRGFLSNQNLCDTASISNRTRIKGSFFTTKDAENFFTKLYNVIKDIQK